MNPAFVYLEIISEVNLARGVANFEYAQQQWQTMPYPLPTLFLFLFPSFVHILVSFYLIRCTNCNHI